MNEKLIDWNLGFARDDVVASLEKLFARIECIYTRTDTDAETRFQARWSQGALDVIVHPLASYRSPFNLQATLYRTMLTVFATGLSTEQEESLRRRLTLAFLRVGG